MRQKWLSSIGGRCAHRLGVNWGELGRFLTAGRGESLVFAFFSVGCWRRRKMADGVDIDLYADDLEQDFAQTNVGV